MEFRYGDSWEKFPMKENETWLAGENRLRVMDITTDNCIPFFSNVDLIYVDPPWNLGNVKSFYTKAHKRGGGDFALLLERLIALFKVVPMFYCEMGKQYVDLLVQMIEEAGGVVTDVIDIMYYKTHPCRVVRGSFNGRIIPLTKAERKLLTGVDDDDAPEVLLRHIETWVNSIGDPCVGLGATSRAAFKTNKVFFGTELNPRRIANVAEWFSKKGLDVTKE